MIVMLNVLQEWLRKESSVRVLVNIFFSLSLLETIMNVVRNLSLSMHLVYIIFFRWTYFSPVSLHVFLLFFSFPFSQVNED